MCAEKNEPLFNSGAAVYDEFRFLHAPADLMVARAGLKTGDAALDIACGTGRATLEAARLVGRDGSVTGIDIADKLLEVAEQKALSEGLNNISLIHGDASELSFGDGTFDVVQCASSIFFFTDRPAVIREWFRVVKPGGTLILAVFGKGVFEPVLGLIEKRLSRFTDLAFPKPVSTPTDTPQKCRALMTEAGFSEADVFTESTEFYVDSPEECWRQVAGSLLVRPRLGVLEKADRERVKNEVLAEIGKMMTDQGIRLEVPVTFCRISKG